MGGHYCFTHEKYCDTETIDRVCKLKEHDIDFEDSYKPTVRTIQQKQDPSMVYAELVEKIAVEMFEKTHLVWIETENKFYYWNYDKKVWMIHGNSFLMKLFNKVAPRVLPNKKKIFADVIFQLKLDVVTLPKNFEPDRNFIYFGNEALNLEKLEVWPKQVDHHIQIALKTDLDLKAKQPKIFLNALAKAIPDLDDRFDCLQALSSVLLIRHQRIEKAFFFLGSGGNGKSTIMKVMDNIFGQYIAHVDMLDLQKDGFSKTALVDKLANSFSEISKMKQKDVGVFKAIASGDAQSINSKFKERFDAVIKVIQFYSSNQMPEIEDVNEGFIRRAHPIEFNQVIKDKDPYIDDKLNSSDERRKILALLIKVARYTKTHGFRFEKTFKEKENILLKKSNPINEFLDAKIVFRRIGYTILKKDLYKLYEKYCEDSKFRPANTVAFSKFLSICGFNHAGRNENPHWVNLGVPPIDEGQKLL